MPTRFWRLFVLIGFVGAVLAQKRQTLETLVTATRNEITLRWSKKHVWDAELVRGGVSLYAEYKAANGVGLDCLQRGKGTPPNRSRGANTSQPRGCSTTIRPSAGEERIIRFELPDELLAAPLSQVCLQLRTQNGKLLPIRQPGKEGNDATNFQYAEWSTLAAAHLERSKQEVLIGEIERAVKKQAEALASQEKSNQSKGWVSLGSCENVPRTSASIIASGRPIAAPEEQDGVARRLCVLRFLNRKEPESLRDLFNLETWTQLGVNAGDRKKWETYRGNEHATFLRDYRKYAPGIQYQPYFGAPDDKLPLQSLTVQVRQRLEEARKSGSKLSSKDMLGYVGGILEAYHRCVSDGKRQLELNYEKAQTLKKGIDKLPDLIEKVREETIQECKMEVTKLNSMQNRLAELEAQLRSAREVLSAPLPPAPNAVNRELNFAYCSVSR